MAERCAVIGVGQTVAKSKREDVSIAGLVREAALAALEDAGLTFADIDAVVVGKAPDMFEGVMMPELYLAPALGAVGKPMFRVHTAGSVGGSTAIVASHLVASGVHERVLTVAFEKQSDSDAMWALSVPQPFSPPLLAGAGGYFAPIIRAYMRRSGAPDHIGILVAVNPSGGALAANALMVAGLTRIGEAAQRIIDGGVRRALAHATSGPCLQQNLVCALAASPDAPASPAGGA